MSETSTTGFEQMFSPQAVDLLYSEAGGLTNIFRYRERLADLYRPRDYMRLIAALGIWVEPDDSPLGINECFPAGKLFGSGALFAYRLADEYLTPEQRVSMTEQTDIMGTEIFRNSPAEPDQVVIADQLMDIAESGWVRKCQPFYEFFDTIGRRYSGDDQRHQFLVGGFGFVALTAEIVEQRELKDT